jgi:hypothetical protein
MARTIWPYCAVRGHVRAGLRAEDGPHNLAVLRHMAPKAMQKGGFQGSLR